MPPDAHVTGALLLRRLLLDPQTPKARGEPNRGTKCRQHCRSRNHVDAADAPLARCPQVVFVAEAVGREALVRDAPVALLLPRWFLVSLECCPCFPSPLPTPFLLSFILVDVLVVTFFFLIFVLSKFGYFAYFDVS